MENNMLTFEEVKNLDIPHIKYENWVYVYKSKSENYYHFIKNWKDLLKWLNVINFDYYIDWDYVYQTEDKYFHLIRDKKDLLAWKNAITCIRIKSESYSWYSYKTEQGIFFIDLK
jgi:hypothetical protein